MQLNSPTWCNQILYNILIITSLLTKFTSTQQTDNENYFINPSISTSTSNQKTILKIGDTYNIQWKSNFPSLELWIYQGDVNIDIQNNLIVNYTTNPKSSHGFYVWPIIEDLADIPAWFVIYDLSDFRGENDPQRRRFESGKFWFINGDEDELRPLPSGTVSFEAGGTPTPTTSGKSQSSSVIVSPVTEESKQTDVSDGREEENSSSTSDNKTSSNGLKIGLGVGLGAGIPLLVIIGASLYFLGRRKGETVGYQGHQSTKDHSRADPPDQDHRNRVSWFRRTNDGPSS